MTMGPFTIVKDNYGHYQVNDRWCDPVATVGTHDHGEAWIELFYKTQALQDQFLRTNIHVPLATLLRERLAAVVNRARAKKAAAQRPPQRQMKLSCGAKVYVECAA